MKDETKEVKSQVAGTISTLMTVAFGLIAALAWNSAIQAILLRILPKGSGIIGLLIYAIVITIVAVLVTFIIARALGKPPVQEVRIVEWIFSQLLSNNFFKISLLLYSFMFKIVNQISK